MDTDVARARLEALRAELDRREWPAKIVEQRGRPVLEVRNPRVDMSDTVVWREGAYRYSWGPEISSGSDVPAVAARIMHVLRDVSSAGR